MREARQEWLELEAWPFVALRGYGTQNVCKFVCGGGQNPISGTRAAFGDLKTGIFMGNLPIEPPVLTSRTRTQEQVETTFTWRSDGFSR